MVLHNKDQPRNNLLGYRVRYRWRETSKKIEGEVYLITQFTWLRQLRHQSGCFRYVSQLTLAAKIRQIRITDTTARSTRRTLYICEDLSSRDKCSKTMGLGVIRQLLASDRGGLP